MNSRITWRWGLGVAAAALLFGVGSQQRASSQATNTLPSALEAEADAETAAPTLADEETTKEAQAAEEKLAEADAKPISKEKPLPASIKLTGALAELVKLAESGVEESVMMAFVTNSTRPFNLGVEQIIYLNDIGVPGSVVTAMIQRDQALKGLAGGPEPVPAAPASIAAPSQATSQPADPGVYAPQPVAPPAPPQMAVAPQPPMDNATVEYLPPPAEDTGYSTYYDSLAPYGTWVDVAGYGPCWQPTVVIANPTWRPYCDSGRWVYTDCGWYWLSGYSWGWAPFHYGRWFQHHRLGWCWAPDTVWGPSWVSWRYGSSYCGWAPLPPGAWYRPGIGLTFRGRHVGASFGFGLGIGSFAFVDVGHFRNSHLNRHALPHQQAIQVYDRTVASTRIVGDRHGVINHGIPVARVAAATGTEIHRVAIHDADSAAGHGARGEQFEGNSRSLSVVRPQFPSRSGTAPASGGHSTSTTPLMQRGSDRAGQPTVGRGADAGNQGARPSSTAPAWRRDDGSRQTASPATTPAAEASRLRSTTTPQQNSSRPSVNSTSQQTTRSAWSAATQSRSTPRANETPARSESQRPNTASSYQAPTEMRRSTPTPTAGNSRSRITTSPQESLSRPAANPRPQPMTSPAWRSPAPSGSAGSAPRAVMPPVRSESPRQYTAPSYQAPAVAPRIAPAPSPAPQPARSYSAPSPPPMQRAPAMESRPSYSAPSAPAASAPASRSQSSSDRRGR